MKYFESDYHLALMLNTNQLGQSGGSSGRGKHSSCLLMKAAALKLVGLRPVCGRVRGTDSPYIFLDLNTYLALVFWELEHAT